MRIVKSLNNGLSRELCIPEVSGTSVDVNSSLKNAIPNSVAGKPWSSGEGDGIIETNQEMITVIKGPRHPLKFS